MKRLLTAAAALVCAFGFGATAQAQLTTITASHLKISGTDISAGKVLFTPVNAAGTAISFAQAGGGLNGPFPFSCTITTGALSGCTLPDTGLTNPVNIFYRVTVMDTSLGAPTTNQYTFPAVGGVTGTTWALDSYAPPLIPATPTTLMSSYGTAAPPNPCNNGTLYVQNVTPPREYACVNGVPVPVGLYVGATFTASGCSNTTLVGQATAGSYHSGTTGSCTVVITPGPTAVNGWYCGANNLTTTANAVKQTASSTTSCTLSGTTVTGDVISFGAHAY